MTTPPPQQTPVVSLEEARRARASVRLSRSERVLSLFAEIRPGEGPAILVLFAHAFAILAACYLLKPVADGLLAGTGLGGLSKTEVKAYARVGQSLLLLVLVPLYARMADILPRQALMRRVNISFMAALMSFWLLRPGFILERAPYFGLAFYVWVGLFGVAALAQFWTFAADLHSEEAGKRVFPVIALGASAGGAAGAWIAARLMSVVEVDAYALMLPAAALIALSMVLARLTERLEMCSPAPSGQRGSTGARRVIEPSWNALFATILGNRYLAATAIVILLLNWVSTNGENFLFGTVQALLDQQVRAQGLTDPAAIQRFVVDETTAFYGSFFFWTTSSAFLIQALIASRLIKLGGFGVALLTLPVIALLSYAAIALFPVLALVKVTKIAENATSYSINNTARQLLWLPTSAEVKYKARAVIDTLVVRLGDGFAALTVFIGVNLLQLPLQYLYAFNLALIGAWLAAAFVVAREHSRLSAVDAPGPSRSSRIAVGSAVESPPLPPRALAA